MEIKKRDYALDLLKFLCAVLLFLAHYEGQFKVHFPDVSFAYGKYYYGLTSECFFVISGYLSYHSIERIHNGLTFDKYFSSRYLRLIPVVAISTVFYGIMTYVTWNGQDFSVWKIILTCFGVQAGGAFNEMFVNSHLWYLSVLLICYALFFIVIRVCQRVRINWRYGCFFMVVFAVSAYNIPAWNTAPFVGFAADCGYMSFFTGVLLASVLAAHRPNRFATLLSLFIVVGFALLLIFRFEIMEYGLLFIMVFIYYPALIVLFESAPAQKLLDRKFFGFLGQISFGIYVWHMEFNILLSVLDSAFHLGINFASRWTEIIVLLIGIGVGAASFYLLEKPIDKAIKKKLA